MKALLIFFLSLNAFASYNDEVNFNAQIDAQAKTYTEKSKSNNPNALVVYISSRVNRMQKDIQETNFVIPNQIPFDDTTPHSNLLPLEFFRPLTSGIVRSVNECVFEDPEALVVIEQTKILVRTKRFPMRLRMICYGENRNYREAYQTFRE